MTLILIGTILLLSGIAFFIKRPLSLWTQISELWDIGVGTVLVVIFIIFISSAYISPRLIEDDLAKEPCGADTPQGRCYNLNREICESLWDRAHQACQLEMGDFVKAHPTSLMGPALNKCKARKMDKGIRFNRANSDSSYCKAYFEFIDEQN